MSAPDAPDKMTDVSVYTVTNTAVPIHVNGRPFLIANSGSQSAYIHPKATATIGNGFLIQANTQIINKFTVDNDLSVISNATGTTITILWLSAGV